MQKHQRTTVPQFGGWENNGGFNPNYSAVFSTARNNKKKQSRNEGITNNYSPYMEFMTPSQSRYTSTPPPVFRAHPSPFKYHEPNDLDSYPNKKKNNRGLRREMLNSSLGIVVD
ncbi:hypothetical protein V2J09_018532 [Rumex salicifolius]